MGGVLPHWPSHFINIGPEWSAMSAMNKSISISLALPERSATRAQLLSREGVQQILDGTLALQGHLKVIMTQKTQNEGQFLLLGNCFTYCEGCL